MTDEQGADTKIDLAAEADFVLGGLKISPSACRAVDGEDEQRVEPRVMEVLIVLVRQAGRTVTREQLIETCWGGRTVSDDAVTRVIARLRALGRNGDVPHFTLETVPKVGFRLVVPARPAKDVPADLESPDPDTQRPADPQPVGWVGRESRWMRHGVVPAILIVAVLAFAALLAFDQAQVPRIAEKPRVIVSPINVLNTQADLHRLAGNATSALVRSLAGVGIQTSMSTSASEPGRPEVEHRAVMLAGSTDFDGVAYHVNVTVSDHESGRVLWSGSFERPAAELRGLEEEVAYDVSAILRCAFDERRLSAAEMPVEVLHQFMNACEGMLGWRSDKALEATQKLVAVAPSYADAHAFRAIALDRRAENLDYLSKEAKDLRREALAEAQKALELDPDAAAAHVALGKVMDTQPNFAVSEHHFLRALEIDPENADALNGYGELLRQVGRLGAARETFGRLSTGQGRLVQSAFLEAMTGNAIEAQRLLERLAVTRPYWARSAEYAIVVFWTEPSVALAKLPEFQEREGAREMSCVEAHLRALSEPVTQPHRGLPESCEAFAIDWRIRMLARQGDIDAAYELMKQLPNSRSFFAFLFYPEMKAFRHDVRFMPLADSLGLVRYWRESNEWPDFCAEPDLPYDCRAWRFSKLNSP